MDDVVLTRPPLLASQGTPKEEEGLGDTLSHRKPPECYKIAKTPTPFLFNKINHSDKLCTSP